MTALVECRRGDHEPQDHEHVRGLVQELASALADAVDAEEPHVERDEPCEHGDHDGQEEERVEDGRHRFDRPVGDDRGLELEG